MKSLDPNKRGFRKRILSFAFFLALSTVFWFLNALNEKFTEYINYPIIYSNLPQNKTQVLNLPKSIILKVQTDGYSLLDYYLSPNKKPIEIDYKNISTKKAGNQLEYILLKPIVERQLIKLMPQTYLIQIQPDTLKFSFKTVISKRVKVIPNIEYRLEKGFVLKDSIKSIPDSITIKGASDLLRNIKSVYTGKVKIEGTINAALKKNVAIETNRNYEIYPQRVNVIVDVEQSTENTIEIPINIINNNSKYRYQLIPNTIKLRYETGISQFNTVSDEMFVASVSMDSLDTFDDVVKVVLTQQPSNTFNIEFTPNFVEYIRTNNND
ncbi:MAG: YbbR-like domain-containing protein [Bacteroidales bacterium]|nr:YbbR-like domain-containing protein [Bacteroidales bacterium]